MLGDGGLSADTRYLMLAGGAAKPNALPQLRGKLAIEENGM